MSLLYQNNDIYCWECHKIDPNLLCSNCARSFHKLCVDKNFYDFKSVSSFQCLQCETISFFHEDNNYNFKNCKSDLYKLIYATFVVLQEFDKYNNFSHIENYPDHDNFYKCIINPVDFTKIQAKIDKKLYLSFECFIEE